MSFLKVKQHLDNHAVIGWDFDLTLHQGPHSTLFRQYIIDNPEKEHHIITFRDNHTVADIPYYLSQYGYADGVFKTTTNLENSNWYMAYINVEFELDVTVLEPGETRLTYATELAKVTNDDLWQQAADLMGWKAKVAKKMGCTILVDDLVEMVADGCKQQGIKLLNAINLELT